MKKFKFLIAVKDIVGIFAKYSIILSPDIVPNNLQSSIIFFTDLLLEEFDKNLTKDKKWIENINEFQLTQKLKLIIFNSDFIEPQAWNIDLMLLSVKIAKEVWELGSIEQIAFLNTGTYASEQEAEYFESLLVDH